MNKNFIFLYITLLLSNNYVNYEIDFWGIPAANCSYSIIDTVFHNIPSKKMQYKVETISFYDFFYPVKNKYTIIFDTETYNLLYYEKNSFQPKVVNNIKTNFIDGRVSYSNGNIVDKNETNIFVLLYLLGEQKFNIIESFPIIDREGKKFSYDLELFEKNYLYSLSLNPISKSDFSIVEDTDIFTWGLFLDNTKNHIFIDSEEKIIDQCIFKKGIVKLAATRIK